MLDDRQNPEKALDDMLESETKSEALFDAYRSVALSRTKTIGPRAIGYLTAQAVNANRTLDDREAAWGEFYETASDLEIPEAKAFYSKYLPHTPNDPTVRRNAGDLEITWSEDGSSSRNGAPLDQTFNLHHVGTFASRLNALGLLTGTVIQHLQTGQEFVETGLTVFIRYQVTIRESDLDFIEIINRALRQ